MPPSQNRWILRILYFWTEPKECKTNSSEDNFESLFPIHDTTQRQNKIDFVDIFFCHQSFAERNFGPQFGEKRELFVILSASRFEQKSDRRRTENMDVDFDFLLISKPLDTIAFVLCDFQEQSTKLWNKYCHNLEKLASTRLSLQYMRGRRHKKASSIKKKGAWEEKWNISEKETGISKRMSISSLEVDPFSSRPFSWGGLFTFLSDKKKSFPLPIPRLKYLRTLSGYRICLVESV